MDKKFGSSSQQAYSVLYERENIELQGCLQNIELFRKYICDYESLKERLSTMADKTSYDIMVPIAGSKLAYMPGYIHHTNEVLVLIGENYFVEKSTKEAIEFVDRRITFCNKKIDELQAQQRMLQNWLGATADIQRAETELVDITETWSEEELQKWKVKHKQSVQQHKKESSQQYADIDINKILAKYEKEEEEVEKLTPTMDTIAEDDDESKPNLVEPTTTVVPIEQPATFQLSERSQPNNQFQQTTIATFQQQRPISKIKASPMKK